MTVIYQEVAGAEVRRDGDRVELRVGDATAELDHDSSADLANAIAAAGVDAAPHGGRSR
jgi:hypothetical protein